MRFVMWQQALLIIAFVALLVAYVVVTYAVTSGRKPRKAILLALGGMMTFGSLIWVAAGMLLFAVARQGMGDVGGEYALIERTYDSTLGFPFSIAYYAFLQSLFANRDAPSYVIAATIPATLLLLGATVVAVGRLLAGGPWAIEMHPRGYAGLLTGAASVVLVVLLWPRPLHNPEMPDVPMPENAVAVEYGYTAHPRWPATTFTVEGRPPSEILEFYRDVLVADGWRLEQGTAYQEYPVAGEVLFSRNARLLQISALSGASGAQATLILRGATPAEMNALGVPAPTPGLIPR
jgi:hypothetical protein